MDCAEVALTLGLLLLPAHAGVDPFEEAEEADLLRLEQTLVTVASRYAQTVRQAPSLVTVVTDEQIRQYGHRTISDVLRGVATRAAGGRGDSGASRT